MKKHIFTKTLASGALVLALILGACTDLEVPNLTELPDDSAQLLSDPANAAQFLAAGYAPLRNMMDQGNWYGMVEHVTDEMQGPTRGTDWDDNGIWRTLHTHSWDPFHAFIQNAWNTLSEGQAKCVFSLTTIQQFPDAGVPDKAQYLLELRYLRAFYIFCTVDMFGQVPYREVGEIDFKLPPSKIMSSAEATEWLITELNAIIPQMKDKGELPYGRATKTAAQTLLAKVYLNSEAWGAGAKYNEAVTACNDVINSGKYALNADYFGIFKPDNSDRTSNADESIFVTTFEGNQGLNANIHQPMRTLHYNQTFGPGNTYSPWNGFTTIADFYNKWDQTDKRFKDDSWKAINGFNLGFLEGQQFKADGTPLNDRGGNPLIFTVECPLNGANEAQGVRVVKYAPDNNATDGSRSGNDFVIFRVGDVYLMRAEAAFRAGTGDRGQGDLDAVRGIRGVPSVTVSADALLNEYGYELYWEGAHRRQALIRFSKFNEAWTNKAASPEYRKLFSIPQTAIDANPNLKQNPGY